MVFSEISVQLHYGIHRIVAADIEKSLYIILCEGLRDTLVVAVIVTAVFQLETARAKHRRGSALQ